MQLFIFTKLIFATVNFIFHLFGLSRMFVPIYVWVCDKLNNDDGHNAINQHLIPNEYNCIFCIFIIFDVRKWLVCTENSNKEWLDTCVILNKWNNCLRFINSFMCENVKCVFFFIHMSIFLTTFVELNKMKHWPIWRFSSLVDSKFNPSTLYSQYQHSPQSKTTKIDKNIILSLRRCFIVTEPEFYWYVW